MQTKPAIFFLTVFLTVLLFSTLIHPAFATTIFSDGFESGDFSAWTSYYQGTGNTLQVSSVDKHHGNYSLRAVNGGTDENWVRKDVGSQSTLYTRFYIKVTNLGLSTVVLYHAADVGYFTCVWITSSGNLRLRYYDGGSTYTVTSSTTLSTNTWYCLEFKAVKSTTAGEYRVYLDGSEVTDLTQTNKNNGSGGIDFIRVGSACGYQSSNSLAVYIDCVVVADTYIGPEGGTTVTKTVTEYLAGYDVKGRVASLYRSKIDYVGLFDSKQRVSSLYRVFSEQLGLLDVKMKGLLKNVSEQLGILESKIKMLSKVFKDYVGLLDVKIKQLSKIVKDYIGMLDVKTRIASLHRIFNEYIGLVDNRIIQKSLHRVFVEYLGLKDTYNRIVGIYAYIKWRYFQHPKQHVEVES